MSGFWRDLRFGAHMLRKHLGTTLLAALALALGIGANTAIYSVVYGILLKPLAFPESERLIWLFETDPKQNFTRLPVSPANFLDWCESSKTFSALSAHKFETLNLVGDGAPERLRSGAVTSEFFSMLRVEAALGRTFGPQDEFQTTDNVVVLSDGLWRERFGQDPELVGKTVKLNGVGHTVLGVMPPGFDFMRRQLWRPLRLGADAPRDARYLYVFGRLAADVSLSAAQSELDAVSARLAREHPETNADRGANLIPLQEVETQGIRSTLLLLLAGGTLVLLIACANTAGVLLVRGVGREREFAVRTAFGASRFRLVRLLLTESLLLALLGGAGGVFLAWGGVRLVAPFASGLPRFDQVSVGWETLLYSIAVSAAAGLIFGVLPALLASQSGMTAFRESGRGVAGGFRQQRIRRVLVGAETALSLLLLIGAGLMVKSLSQLVNADPGFDPESVLAMDLSLPREKYPSEEAVAEFHRQALERITVLPGVESAGLIANLPLSGGGDGRHFRVVGRPIPEPGKEPVSLHEPVTPGYFSALRIGLFQGRLLDESDGFGSPPVAVVSRSFVRKFLGHGEALGQRLEMLMPMDGESRPPVVREVVGVVEDVKHWEFAQENPAQIYVPAAQEPPRRATLAIRSRTDVAATASAVRAELLKLDREQSVYNVKPMTDYVASSLARQRLMTSLLAIFSAVSLALAVIGVYGVVSFAVQQRAGDIGVRLALGAGPRHVLALIFRQEALATPVGVLVGLLTAPLAMGYLADHLHKVSVTDWTIYAAAAAVLAAAGLFAGYLPARKALKLDPSSALRR